MADLFLSYASEDRETASLLAGLLKDQGWTVWWDRHILAGASFDRTIEREIQQARGVIVLWSYHSVESDWVRAEARTGRERKVLIPILIEEARIPLEFSGIQAATVRRNHLTLDDPGFGNLVVAIEATLGPSPVRAAAGVHAPSSPPARKMHRWVWIVTGGGAAATLIVGIMAKLLGPAVPQTAVASMAGVADANTALATPTTPPARRPEPLAALPGPRLFKGSKGADVADLRAALRILGYLDAREDSASEQVFGTGTRDAVIRFQRDRGLAPDGIVGPQLLAEFKSLARVRGVSP